MFEDSLGCPSSDKEDGSSSHESSRISDFDTITYRKKTMPHCEENNELNSILATSLAEKSLDDEESFSLDSSPRSCQTKSSQNLEGVYDSSEKSSSSNLEGPFNELSFEHRGLIQLNEEKVAVIKDLLNKVNEVFVNWRINEFVLDTVKSKSTSWTKQIKAITKSSEIQRNIYLRNESGEITNLLGLDEEDINLSTSRSLACFSKSAFLHHTIEVVRANVAKLKLQKKCLQDEFGAHSMKVMVGMMTKERKEQADLYKQVEDLQIHARQQLSSSHSIVHQLATLWHNSNLHLQTARFELIRNKASYIKTTVSTLKERLEQSLLVDENMKKKMDIEGDNLKTQVMEMREELKALQKTLAEYEKKEAASDKYREIVIEFGKLKKQLDHKYHTLKMLNDADMSF